MASGVQCLVALALLAFLHGSVAREISSDFYKDVAETEHDRRQIDSAEESVPNPVKPYEDSDDDSFSDESSEEDWDDDSFSDESSEEDEEDEDEQFSVKEGGEDDLETPRGDLEQLAGGEIRTVSDVGFDKYLDVMMGDQPVVKKPKRRKGKKDKKRKKKKGKGKKRKGKKKSRKNKGGKKLAGNGTEVQADMPRVWVDENGKLIEDDTDALAGAVAEEPDNFWPDNTDNTANDDNNNFWPRNNRNPWDNTNNNINNVNTVTNLNQPDPPVVDPRVGMNNPHRNQPWDRVQPVTSTGGAGQVWPRNNRITPDMGSMNKYFDVKPLEVFIQACPECFVQVPGTVCPFHGPALELKKWAGELEDVLSHGCKRPEECKEPGTCCLSRMDPFEPTVVRMTQMLKDVYNMVQRNCKGCAVDGNWGPWTTWSSCDRTCDKGSQVRTRQCNNPPPSNTGQDCMGDQLERKDCYNPDCCEDGQWSQWGLWSQCPTTCGQAQVSRQRTCSNPAPNHCGQTCPGDSYETKTEFCGPPAVNGNWASWQPWSRCSQTCDFATKSRIRTCSNPPPNACGVSCPGSGTEETACNNPSCLRCGKP